MKKSLILIFLLFLFCSLTMSAATYYVSPTGNDGAAGTIAAPWATWHYAFGQLAPGDILYIRGGTYSAVGVSTGGLYVGARLSKKAGTSGSQILISNYGTEVPILDCTNITQAGWKVGLFVDDNSYVTFRGLTIQNMSERGETTQSADGVIIDTDIHVTFDRCTVTRCGYGFRLNGSASNYVSFTNCDAYDNGDTTFGAVSSGGAGGYCDGFGIHTDGQNGHFSFTGCRAWDNSDDGWDLINSGDNIVFANCWSFQNGHTTGDWTNVTGDGCGFKIGGQVDGTAVGGVQRLLSNCLSAYNTLTGFDANYGNVILNNTLYNCISYNDITSGYHFVQPGAVSTLKNCIEYSTYNTRIYEGVSSNVENHNTWDGVVTANNADFVSTDWTQLMRARQADGSLPVVSFMHLAAGSKLIDAGVDVGLPYTGKAPDLGAFETQSGSAPAVPAYTSSAVANATPSILEMTYNMTLANIAPAASAFSVMVNSAVRSVSAVVISGTKVQLTLASAIKYSDIVTVVYTKPATNPLQTTAGGLAVSISPAQPVVNNVINSTKEGIPVTITMTVTPNHVHKIINALLTYSATPTTANSPEIISISDLSGNLFIEKQLVTGVTSVKIPINLSSGIYTVAMTSGGQLMATQRMIVY
jgi:uncharacterized repeat protein (TIGR02059 family)